MTYRHIHVDRNRHSAQDSRICGGRSGSSQLYILPCTWVQMLCGLNGTCTIPLHYRALDTTTITTLHLPFWLTSCPVQAPWMQPWSTERNYIYIEWSENYLITYPALTWSWLTVRSRSTLCIHRTLHHTWLEHVHVRQLHAPQPRLQSWKTWQTPSALLAIKRRYLH